ncbi:MAG TPA: hypothetical protein VFT96_06415 [Gemmatimonadaceae bacterium]|nr:hypothetical protein [Gemmatimonadaceae bacterium]
MSTRTPFSLARFTPRTRAAAAACLILGAAACAGDAPEPVDSTLARDLALANVVAQPQFNDAPLAQEPEPQQVAPESPSVPVTSRPADRAPVRATPRPAPTRPAPRPTAPASTPERDVAEAPAPTPEPAPAPAPSAAAGFAAGTRLALTTGARVCTVSGRPGDKMAATLRDPVRGTGGAMIPAGSTIVLEVASVTPGDPAESGTITFRVRSLDIDDKAHAASGSGAVNGGLDRAPVPRVNASDRKKVIGGAILGAIVGRVVEGSARGAVIGAATGGAAGAISAKGDQRFEGCLPAGSPVTIVLEEGLTIT